MLSKITASGKDFVKSLFRHWIWTVVFLLIAAPVLVALLTPVRAKLGGLPVIGRLFGAAASTPKAV